MGNTIEKSMISRATELVGSRVEDEFIVMSLEEGQFYFLEGPSCEIWAALEKPTNLDALVAQLIELFDIDEDTCRAETLRVLNDMQSKKMIALS